MDVSFRVYGYNLEDSDGVDFKQILSPRERCKSHVGPARTDAVDAAGEPIGT